MKPICRWLNLDFRIETSRPCTKPSRPREFRGMKFHEVGHARRRLAGELEVIVAHPVIAPLLVEFGHDRQVVDDMLQQARRFGVVCGALRASTSLSTWRRNVRTSAINPSATG